MPRALYLVAPRTLEFHDYDLAPLGPRDVRLQSVLSGISHGTELNLYRGTSPFVDKRFDPNSRMFVTRPDPGFSPSRLGYELVSRVVEIGSQVDEVAVGGLVHTATPHQPATIVNMDETAQAAIPMQVLPGEVTPERGVFAALVGVAVAAVQDAQIKVGDHVVVFGLGTIGLIVAQLARLNGALRVTAVDPLAKRRAVATRLGVDEAVDPDREDVAAMLKGAPGARGPDVVIEASGNYGALQNALRCAPMAGTVVTLGYYQGGATPVCLGEEWHHNRLTMVSSMAVWDCPSRFCPLWDRPRITSTAIELLARGLVNVDGLVSHRFPYRSAADAYRLIDEQPEETIKVVLEYGGHQG